MTTQIPDFMPVLSFGAHTDPSNGGCFMELASFLAGEKWSDRPACTNPALAAIARSVNDQTIGDDLRSLLAPMIPDVIGTGGAADDRRVTNALLAWMYELFGSTDPNTIINVFWSLTPIAERMNSRSAKKVAARSRQFLRDAIDVAHAALGREAPAATEVSKERWEEARELVAA